MASRTTDWPRLSGEFAGRFTAHKTPYAYSELEWNAPGTEPAQFTLTASAIEKEELIKIARSMTPSAGAARWLGKRNSWRLAARVMGSSAPDKLGAAVTVIRKRVTFIFGPAAKAEPKGADGIAISASSNNPDMRALLVTAATMPGHIRLVELPQGTRVAVGHTADAHKVTGPDGTPLLEAQVLKLPGTVLDEKELAFTRYLYPDGSIWGKIEIVAASRDKAARYAESHSGYALAVVLDDSMVLGYVPPEFLAHDFPRQVEIVMERGWLFHAILESGPLPARVEAQPAEGKSAE